VPLLVHGLEHPDADVTGYCSEMLARLAGSSAAQTAIRCAVCCCKLGIVCCCLLRDHDPGKWRLQRWSYSLQTSMLMRFVHCSRTAHGTASICTAFKWQPSCVVAVP
jgi:hypothetical protein